jgi:hypothetical protein
MNVSITEDATMSRTRFDGGATVVLVDAIVWVLLPFCDDQRRGAQAAVRPGLSLFPDEMSVNKNEQAIRLGH